MSVVVATAAVYLNTVFCTSPDLNTCMKPHYYGTASAGLPLAKREEICKKTAQEFNVKVKGESFYFRCDLKPGQK